jgi:hypothetical protein
VCGDGEGTLLLYHWGLWGDCTDRFPAHSDSVDSLLALGDSVLCTGSSDGTIRYHYAILQLDHTVIPFFLLDHSTMIKLYAVSELHFAVYNSVPLSRMQLMHGLL